MMTSSNGNIFRITGVFWSVNSPHKGQWREALMFFLICGWANIHEDGDMRRHRTHYDVIVMSTLQKSASDATNKKMAFCFDM